MTDGTVQVGTCRCGGYGVLYDESTEWQTGRCHHTLDEIKLRAAFMAGWLARVPGSTGSATEAERAFTQYLARRAE